MRSLSEEISKSPLERQGIKVTGAGLSRDESQTEYFHIPDEDAQSKYIDCSEDYNINPSNIMKFTP